MKASLRLDLWKNIMWFHMIACALQFTAGHLICNTFHTFDHKSVMVQFLSNFYRTPVRWLSTLVTNSLTNSLMILKLDWCDSSWWGWFRYQWVTGVPEKGEEFSIKNDLARLCFMLYTPSQWKFWEIFGKFGIMISKLGGKSWRRKGYMKVKFSRDLVEFNRNLKLNFSQDFEAEERS